jgi:defect-in-organelle-trafficking protein DotA
LAADFSSNPLWDMFKDLTFDPKATDVSVGFLGKMFGAVPGVPHLAAAGTTLLGTVFGMFNAGILALSGVFLSYTVTRILTETTMDGAAMGKSTTIWTAVRCALSTSLLVPQASGYSMINGIVMWVIVQSAGLANLTWDRALDFLEKGGPTYASSTSTVDYTLINYLLTSDSAIPAATSSNIGSADVLRSLVCSNVLRNALVKSQSVTRNRLENIAKSRDLTADESIQYVNSSRVIPEKSETFSLYKDVGGYSCNTNAGRYTCESGVFKFPYLEMNTGGTNPLKDYGLSLKDSDIPIPSNLTGACGEIPYTMTVNNKDTYDTFQRYMPKKLQGLEDMITILEPVAKDLVRKISSIDDKGKRQLDPEDITTYKVYMDKDGKDYGFFKNPDLDSIRKYNDNNYPVTDFLKVKDLTSLPIINWPLGGDEMLSAAAAYQAALAPAQVISTPAIDNLKKEKFSEAKRIGWIAAGNYYKLLAAVNSSVQNEYDKYRLVAASSKERSTIPYNTLFTIDGASGINKLMEAIDKDSKVDLEKSLKWIYLAHPYAKLHGKSLTYALTGSTISLVLSDKETEGLDKIISKISGESTKESIRSEQRGGAAALVLMPPVAIAVLSVVPLKWLGYDVATVLNAWRSNMVNADTTKDPILKLQLFGDAMMQASISYVTQLISFFSDITIALGTGSTVATVASAVSAAFTFMGIGIGPQLAASSLLETYNMLADMSQTMVLMYLPVGLAVVGPMFISGTIFSIYVPLIPYLLFLFGAIGWLISVLIVMAAAPIICFLMLWGNSSQENPLLAREAEQFVTQVIGMFFRPTLMIIGLVAGMVLSYIGVDLLNLGVSNLFDIILGGKEISTFDLSGSIQSSEVIFNLIKVSSVFVVYTFIMVSVVNIAFSPIHLLYSEAMRVAGITAVATGMEEKYLETVKQGVQQYAEAAATGLKDVVSQKGVGRAPKFIPPGKIKEADKGEDKGGEVRGDDGDEK